MAFMVTFSNHRNEPAKRGPFDGLRFDGNDMREHRDGPILAYHDAHFWHLTGETRAYSKLSCDGPVFVAFVKEDGSPSRCFGPFPSFSCIDGVAFAGARIVAFCDQEREDWYSYDLGGHWLSLAVSTEPLGEPQALTAPAAYPGA